MQTKLVALVALFYLSSVWCYVCKASVSLISSAIRFAHRAFWC